MFYTFSHICKTGCFGYIFKRMGSMNEQIPRQHALLTALALGLAGFVCGLIIGLPILGWWLWPVRWTDIPQPPTPVPYPTFTPFPTLTPYPSPTPGPDGFVLNAVLNLYDGPGADYPVLAQVNPKEPLVVLAQNANCAWLKVTTQSQVTGWIINDSATLLLFKPCETLPAGTYRPFSGVLKAPANPGEGQLKIENQDVSDMVLVMVEQGNPGQAVAAAYIRQGETVTITGVPDGTYQHFVAIGSEWNNELQHFTVRELVEFATDPLEFVTTATKYKIWTITFNPALPGNTDFHPVPSQQFPSINE
jgi:hypothetical protein